MVILGIDPGLRKTGYGFIRKSGNSITLLKSGTIKLDTRQSVHRRLLELFNSCFSLFDELKPKYMAIEKVFTGKNARSAFLIGEARAVCIVAALLHHVEVVEYAARTVKQGITGYGDAKKDAVIQMVKLILNYNGDLEEDAADALALAIYHGNIYETLRLCKG